MYQSVGYDLMEFCLNTVFQLQWKKWHDT